jgi:hypothetical protein
MDEEKDVTGSSPEEVVEPVSEDVETPTPSAPETEEKTVPFSRFKEVNDELSRLKKEPPKVVTKTSLGVEDYIDISASLEGLDQKEKEKLAREHKLTGKPLAEIRKDEDFSLWQEAYRAKKEKELSLKPSGTQSESDKPMTFAQRLTSTPSMADKEKLLTDAGLYRSPRPRPDRVDLGRGK